MIFGFVLLSAFVWFNPLLIWARSSVNIISTVAGTGVASSTGTGGRATSATLNRPRDVFLDTAGKI